MSGRASEPARANVKVAGCGERKEGGGLKNVEAEREEEHEEKKNRIEEVAVGRKDAEDPVSPPNSRVGSHSKTEEGAQNVPKQDSTVASRLPMPLLAEDIEGDTDEECEKQIMEAFGLEVTETKVRQRHDDEVGQGRGEQEEKRRRKHEGDADGDDDTGGRAMTTGNMTTMMSTAMKAIAIQNATSLEKSPELEIASTPLV